MERYENGQFGKQLHNEQNGLAETLCSFCARACRNGCSWSRELTPVPGWKADENKNGYFVIACPEYLADYGGLTDPHELNTEGCLKLMEAFITAMRYDYIHFSRQRPLIEKFVMSPHHRNLFFFADPDYIIAQFRKEMRHVI